MPLTAQQQAILDGLDYEEKVESGLDAFIAEGGEAIARYFTALVAFANAKKMGDWGLVNLGREPLTTVSGWEICFNNTKNALVADPSWQPIEKVFRDFEASVTSAQWKQIYSGVSPKLTADQVKALERIGGTSGFRKLVDGKES